MLFFFKVELEYIKLKGDVGCTLNSKPDTRGLAQTQHFLHPKKHANHLAILNYSLCNYVPVTLECFPCNGAGPRFLSFILELTEQFQQKKPEHHTTEVQ